MSPSAAEVLRWGRVPYAEALARQEALQAARIAGQVPDTLVVTEHEPVFTLGLRPDAARHVVWDEARRRREGVALWPTGRGGDVTYHGPGQLVVYPILSLERRRDLHAYLRMLEEVLITTVARYGVRAERREGLTGIWVERRKLAALGVSVRRWVTMHGLALNVAPELRHFSGIVPCGITAEQGSVTSLHQELGPGACPSLSEVGEDLAKTFNEAWPSFLAENSPR
jgi:lipoyl(octanoyl) transferase